MMLIVRSLLAVSSLFAIANGFAGTSREGGRSNVFLGRSLRVPQRAAMARSATTALEMKYTLVLVRHGESTWNNENRFTGWVDCPLSEAGEEEAKKGGFLLRSEGFTFDKAYTSTLKRAIKTLWIILEELDLMYIPIVNNWRLNERHYGALQGLNKQETVEKHGKDQVLVWRRSYDIPPPEIDESSEYFPGNDPRYADVPKDELPRTESLKLTEERFMPEWEVSLQFGMVLECFAERPFQSAEYFPECWKASSSPHLMFI